MTDALALADEYAIPYHVMARTLAHDQARRLRGNNRRYLPARPVLRHADGDDKAFAERCGVNEGTVRLWRINGLIEIHTADRVATRLNTSGPTLWGHDWTAVAALMDGHRQHRKEAA